MESISCTRRRGRVVWPRRRQRVVHLAVLLVSAPRLGLLLLHQRLLHQRLLLPPLPIHLIQQLQCILLLLPLELSR